MSETVLYSDIPFRIRIGITGHRKLLDDENLAKKIREVIETKIIDLIDEKTKRLTESSSHTPVAYTLITALAEGADRLAAKEILKIDGSTIEVVLPFVKEDYLKDFETSESKADFEELFNKASRQVILKRQTLLEEFPDGDFLEGKDKAYENVGRYVVQHSDVLIALWNGKKAPSKGGTAEVIEYAKERKAPVIIISTLSPYNIEVFRGDGINAHCFSEIDKFNLFPVPEKVQKREIEKIKNEYFEIEEAKTLSEQEKENVIKKLLPFYVRASLMAEGNHRFHRYTGILAHNFATLALSIIAFTVLFLVEFLEFPFAYFAFVVEFVLLLSVFLVVFSANKRKAHKRWIENRFLAERIRSAAFLALCGVEVSSIRVPPYLGAGEQHGNWILMVFNEIWNRLEPVKEKECSFEDFSKFIRKSWLAEQLKYHREKAEKAERMNKLTEMGGMIIFAIAIVAPLLHLVLFKPVGLFHFFGEELEKNEKLFEYILIFIALTLPAVGAAIVGIRTHMEYSRLAARSENMKTVLKRLNNRLEHVNDAETMKLLLREVEELVLMETQDWLTLMSFCKPEYVA